MAPAQVQLLASPGLPKSWAVLTLVVPSIDPLATAPRPSTASASSSGTLPWSGRRILVVDDEPEMLMMTRLFLEQAFPGAAIDTAETGQQALGLVAATSYDAIVSDYRMPIMDGLQFLEKAGPRVPPGRAILMTAFADRSLRQRAGQAGFAFLEKAGDPENVVEAIRRALKA